MTNQLTRRELLALGLVATKAPALTAACVASKATLDGHSEDLLVEASGFSGEKLSRERVHAARMLVEFNLQHLEMLRQFDSDEEEPLTVFRL